MKKHLIFTPAFKQALASAQSKFERNLDILVTFEPDAELPVLVIFRQKSSPSRVQKGFAGITEAGEYLKALTLA